MREWILVAFIALTSGCSFLRGPVDEPLSSEEQVIEPGIERRDVRVPKIDTENFEVSGFAGGYSTADFGVSPVYGVRMAYHVTEDVFLEGAGGRSSVSDTSFRNFGLPLFTTDEEDLSYYNLSVGFNLLPGEAFLGTKWSRISAMYVIGGAGTTNFNDDDLLTFNAGFGLRVLLTDWLSLRMEVRDHMFTSDLLGSAELKHNFELTGGLGFFF